MAPEAVVTLLRQFHDRMTAQIFACGGTVEKYIGDAIFAVFGVPTPSDEDAANALRCADMMLDALDDWNASATGRGDAARHRHRPQLRPGGARRCRQRAQLSFTVIGDTVNTASRLQGLTRSLKLRWLCRMRL